MRAVFHVFLVVMTLTLSLSLIPLLTGLIYLIPPLDTEGAEDLVMKSFPFDKYRFNIITLERPSDTLKDLLTQHGYQFLRLLKANSGDTLWMHKSMEGLLDVKASCKIDTTKKYLERPTARLTKDEERDDYCDNVN
jgi:hypothetical protein